MIRAQKITEHGKEKRKGIQVEIRGELEDIGEELRRILFEMEDVIDTYVEDVEEKYDAMTEFAALLTLGRKWLEQRITLRKIGLTEDEIHRIQQMAKDGTPAEEVIREMAAIREACHKRKQAEAADPEGELKEKIISGHFHDPEVDEAEGWEDEEDE